MKKYFLIALLILGSVSIGISQTQVGGNYEVVNSYEYSWCVGDWIGMDFNGASVEISEENGMVKVGHNEYYVKKMKSKKNRKVGSMDYIFKLRSVNGEKAVATFVVFDETHEGETLTQFYFSVPKYEQEFSFDLKTELGSGA